MKMIKSRRRWRREGEDDDDDDDVEWRNKEVNLGLNRVFLESNYSFCIIKNKEKW